jgi:thioredoxin-like negative regulator of GroEL
MVEIIKFEASWCMPCRTLTKSLEGSGLPIRAIDIDEKHDIATLYSIRSVPTLVFIKDGKEVERTTGVISVERIKEIIKRHE